MVDRPRALTVRMAENEVAMLKELADRDGVSVSDYIRLFVRRSHTEAFGAAKPAMKPKPKRK